MSSCFWYFSNLSPVLKFYTAVNLKSFIDLLSGSTPSWYLSFAPVVSKWPLFVRIREWDSPRAILLILIELSSNLIFSGLNALSMQSSPKPSYPDVAWPNM